MTINTCNMISNRQIYILPLTTTARNSCRIYNTNTKDCIANHSAQDEQNNHNKCSYNDWNYLHMIHDIYINRIVVHLLGGTENNVLMMNPLHIHLLGGTENNVLMMNP